MALSRYPEFRPLELSDRQVFGDRFAETQPEISEYTFTNLYSWREAYRFQVSEREGLILLLAETGGGRCLMDPVGRGDRRTVMETTAREMNLPFARLPESSRALFAGRQDVVVVEDRDNADYLYAAADLIELRGKKYDGKRNFIRRFKALGQWVYETLTPETVQECRELEQAWCIVKDCDTDESLSRERLAISDMIENFGRFGLRGGAIRRGGRIDAFAFGELLNPETLVVHILKARADVTGLYPAMMNEFLSHEARDVRWVNLEQDLGIEGLRKSKESYAPARLVMKYAVELPHG